MDLDQLADTGIHTVIVATVDLEGRLIGRRLPARRFLREPEAHVSICTCTLVWDIAQDLNASSTWAGSHTGWHDFVLVPELETLRAYPADSGTAIVLADAVEEDGSPIPFAPRTFLKTQLAKLGEMGYVARAASEIEFYLYEGHPHQLRDAGFRDLVPTTRARSDYSIVGQSVQEPFIQDLRRRMDESGIEIEAAQAEWGFGQWEVNLAHAEALEMADRHVIYKAGLKELAMQRGMTPTFMAKPHQNDMGSSCHVHVSLWSDGAPAFAGENAGNPFSEAAQHFLGGLLNHLGDIALLTNPYVNSYKRHLGGSYSGNAISWGIDNRSAAVRAVGRGAATRLEARYPGADTNPYLTIGSILAAGISGIAEETEPPPPVTGDAYEAEKLQYAPATLLEAIERFQASRWAKAEFGEQFVQHMLEHAHTELNSFLREVTTWDLHRNFEIV